MGLSDELEAMNKQAVIALALDWNARLIGVGDSAKLACWAWADWQESLSAEHYEALEVHMRRLATITGLRDEALRMAALEAAR